LIFTGSGLVEISGFSFTQHLLCTLSCFSTVNAHISCSPAPAVQCKTTAKKGLFFHTQ